ncbi:MAG: 2-oxoglutarate and iron-dependent oxygenase domain-containing protein [Myxococcota bacterium]|nr:2-oxoglutarate and iron-dependent oxygenase domain-containing protein [Myxococcota bacterium]
MSDSVPVVDIRNFQADRTAFIQKLGDAIRDFGFVRVRGHAVSSDVTDPAYDVAKRFFSLDAAVKNRYLIKGGAGQRGYTPYLAESAKHTDIPDLKEFWHVGRELPQEHPLSKAYVPNVWPQEIPGFRSVMLDLYGALEKCSNILLRGLALYMEQEEDRFTSITDDGNSILRILHYPSLEGQRVIPGAVRAAAHEDINIITLLITSTSSGLQLLNRKGQWIDINVEPGEIVADSGDMLSRVTNGYLPSTTHRVVNPDDSTSERYSIPFFVHPRPQSILSVLSNCKGEKFPSPPPDITGIDFLNQRLAHLGLLNL